MADIEVLYRRRSAAKANLTRQLNKILHFKPSSRQEWLSVASRDRCIRDAFDKLNELQDSIESLDSSEDHFDYREEYTEAYLQVSGHVNDLSRLASRETATANNSNNDEDSHQCKVEMLLRKRANCQSILRDCADAIRTISILDDTNDRALILVNEEILKDSYSRLLNVQEDLELLDHSEFSARQDFDALFQSAALHVIRLLHKEFEISDYSCRSSDHTCGHSSNPSIEPTELKPPHSSDQVNGHLFFQYSPPPECEVNVNNPSSSPSPSPCMLPTDIMQVSQANGDLPATAPLKSELDCNIISHHLFEKLKPELTSYQTQLTYILSSHASSEQVATLLIAPHSANRSKNPDAVIPTLLMTIRNSLLGWFVFGISTLQYQTSDPVKIPIEISTNSISQCASSASFIWNPP